MAKTKQNIKSGYFKGIS